MTDCTFHFNSGRNQIEVIEGKNRFYTAGECSGRGTGWICSRKKWESLDLPSLLLVYYCHVY